MIEGGVGMTEYFGCIANFYAIIWKKPPPRSISKMNKPLLETFLQHFFNTLPIRMINFPQLKTRIVALKYMLIFFKV
jgi:hypothetical protein